MTESAGAPDYDALPPPPADAPHGAALLARLVDGLAFRYRWAADGLAPEDLGFEPAPEALTLGGLLEHLHDLAAWMATSAAAARAGTDAPPYAEARAAHPPPAGDPEALRRSTLALLASLRGDLLALGDDGLARFALVGGREPTRWPVWNLLNGPLADSLTHVGQLASWRRMLGKPVPRHDVFRGRPPRPASDGS